jgi:hypothetical protein
MTFRIIALAGVLLSTGVLTGCGREEDTGDVRAETRELGAFDAIDMEGAARLEIEVGREPSVTVEGRESVLSRVETEVRGSTLHIRSKPKDWFISNGRPRVTLRISLPSLASLQLEGGNDVHLTGFAGGETRIRIAGAARMKASGELQQLTVHMSGAGHADLSELLADEAKVTVDGVGSVVVHPKNTLDATMNGVGAILYTGTPSKVNTRMNGLGTIGQRDPKELQQSEDTIDPDLLQPEYEDEKPSPKKLEGVESTGVI